MKTDAGNPEPRRTRSSLPGVPADAASASATKPPLTPNVMAHAAASSEFITVNEPGVGQRMVLISRGETSVYDTPSPSEARMFSAVKRSHTASLTVACPALHRMILSAHGQSWLTA